MLVSCARDPSFHFFCKRESSYFGYRQRSWTASNSVLRRPQTIPLALLLLPDNVQYPWISLPRATCPSSESPGAFFLESVFLSDLETASAIFMFRFSWQPAKAAIGQRHERRDGLPPERDLAHLYMRNASVLSEESPQSQWDLGCCCLVSKEVSLQAEAA